MTDAASLLLDLNPPAFVEGLCDWSQGDGAPTSPTYETGDAGRIARNDCDFGDCLELRKVAADQRLRYMGELPLRRDACVEVRVRIKALRGPLSDVRIAASAGGSGGALAAGLPSAGPIVRLPRHGAVLELAAVIGREPCRGVDIVWNQAVLYAHIGLDLVGPIGGVVRVENMRAREIRCSSPELPGFGDARA